MIRRAVLATVAFATLAACTSASDTQRAADIRHWTQDLAFRTSVEPMPPRARESAAYRVVVRDKKTGQPIDHGEGRIFATSRDGINTWDALVPGKEPGAYHGTLNFVTAGDWAIAIQFRRDTLSKIQRVDWMQGVRAATGPN